jgi:gamma-glutamyl:cysteine ligase YbdK (ATP-grasp superfamily)
MIEDDPIIPTILPGLTSLQASLDEALAENETLQDENERLEEDLLAARLEEPRWGGCRAGHDGEFYLNKSDYCSPACALGAPRGGDVTEGKR